MLLLRDSRSTVHGIFDAINLRFIEVRKDNTNQMCVHFVWKIRCKRLVKVESVAAVAVVVAIRVAAADAAARFEDLRRDHFRCI